MHPLYCNALIHTCFTLFSRTSVRVYIHVHVCVFICLENTAISLNLAQILSRFKIEVASPNAKFTVVDFLAVIK